MFLAPRRAATLALCLFAAPAFSVPAFADTALLIGNSRYEHGATIREGAAVAAAARPLEGVGFEVIEGRNLTTTEIRNRLSQLVAADETDRLVIALSGHFANAPDGGVWFLGTDADSPDRGDVGGQGIDLGTVLAIAARAPGRALVLLATEDRDFPLGLGLSRGIALPEPPQGVALVAGSARDVSQLLWADLLEPGATIAGAVSRNEMLVATGFLPRDVPFLPQAPAGFTADADEAETWDAARELDTEGAYRAYLMRYPFGPNAEAARDRLDELRNDPASIAERTETALGLTRDDRREVQRALSVLGHYDGNIDGIFGAGSRAGIRAWQQETGAGATGFLTVTTRAAILRDGAAREAEIAAEEAEARAAREALDRAFWAQSGQGQSIAGLRAYLERFPQGLFADMARSRLSDLQGEGERRAWESATAQDSIPSYRQFLETYPNGTYAAAARNRIAELQRGAGGQAPGGSYLPGHGGTITQPQPPQANLQAYQMEEARLNLNTRSRQMLELHLARRGFHPGQVDGQFDDQTRAALRAFQAGMGLPQTGYFNQATILRLTQGSGFNIIIH
ncbi:hypothetical protein HKCCE2091_01310 [Rhodobacterales bacterium HKCCE2091]|nr:hypothetical protein [Rhodobacterales bacterium HKCCE2091]